MDGHTPDERLIDFLYGELPEPERERFERHLHECPECRTELAALQGVLRLVRAEPREEPPERISARILQQARAERARPDATWSLSRWLWNPALAGAAAAVMLVLVVAAAVTWSGLEKEEPTPATQALQPLRAPTGAAGAAPVATPAATADEPSDAPAGTKAAKIMREASQHESLRVAESAPDRPASEPVVDAVDLETPRALEEGAGRARLLAKRPSAPKRKALSPAKPAPTAPAPRAAWSTPWEEKRPAEPTLDSPAAGPSAIEPDAKPADDHLAGFLAGEAEPKDDRRFAQPPPPVETVAPATRGQPEKAEAKKDRAALAARRDETGADQEDEDVVSDAAGGAEAQATTVSGASRQARVRPKQAEERAKEAGAPAGGGGLSDGKRLAAEKAGDESTAASASYGADRGPGLLRQAEREAAAGDYRRAAALAREALTSTLSLEQAQDARFALARWLFLSGDCRAALPAIDQALASAPNHSASGAALLDQASCHERLGRLPQAIEGYRRVVRDHPAQAEEARSALRRLSAE